MTEDVINSFIDDNTLKVIEEEESADLLLTGTIISVQSKTTSISQDEFAEERQLVIRIKVECLNQSADRPLWSGTISEFGVISGTADLAESDLAIADASEKIVAEILNKTIAAW